MTAITLVRHATLLLEIGAARVLVDPMLDAAGEAPPVPNTAPERANPLVDVPDGPEAWGQTASAVLLTHLHNDHFDATAKGMIPADLPVFCQPSDHEDIAGAGAWPVTAIERESTDVAPDLVVTRVPARHTIGEHEEALGPGSGYVLSGAGPTVYVAGDCVWSPELTANLDAFDPDVVVVNAGAARFLTGPPITMTAEDVIATARHVPRAQVVAVHLEAINHCAMSRAELRRHTVGAGVAERVRIPADGERLDFW